MRESFPKTLNARKGEIHMKKSLKGLPMNLQLFAEEVTAEPIEAEVGETEVDEATEEKPDADKIVEKLQKRLDSKTKAEKETKTKLEQALARIEELEKGGKKSVKEQSVEEKQTEAQKAKDEEIAKLKQQIKLAEVTQQADEVLKESGLALGKDMLTLLVNEDEEQTYTNVKSLIAFLDKQQKQWEVKRNTGVTPTKLSNSAKPLTKDEILGIKDTSERIRAIQKNPNLFK